MLRADRKPVVTARMEGISSVGKVVVVVVMALLPLLPLVLMVVGRAAAGGDWLNGLQYMVIEILRLVDGINQSRAWHSKDTSYLVSPDHMLVTVILCLLVGTLW